MRKLENSYISALCLELSMLLDAGITPLGCALMLHEDEQSKAGRVLIKMLIGPLENGEPLSSALKQCGFFPRYMVSMVLIGEKTGRLSATLKALSEYYDRLDRLSVSAKNAVLYPTILFVMMIAVVLILIVRVLPIFNDTFNRLGTQMNPLASKLMHFGRMLSDASGIIVTVLGAILALALLICMCPPLRRWALNLFTKAWGHKGVLGEIASFRFISAMALTIASGLDTDDALKMAMAVSGGARHIDARNKKCAEYIQSGFTLYEAMFKANIISARDSRMLSMGARSGNADLAMSQIAARRDRHIQDELDRLIGRLEPVLVALSSVFVGVILLSVMLPLMGIMSAIE